jgi:aryl-alcohol dehydrogenase-like predicted oxidoreductase
MELAEGDHRAFRPDGWIEAGLERLEQVLPIAERARLTPIQLACQWNLAHPAVECVVPTLIQEAHAEACPVEAKRLELALLPAQQRLSDEDVATIREIGDNRGRMALKGANPGHEGEERPDRWGLDEELAEAGRRWGVDPERDLSRH